jgi:hypothetical protein
MASCRLRSRHSIARRRWAAAAARTVASTSGAVACGGRCTAGRPALQQMLRALMGSQGLSGRDAGIPWACSSKAGISKSSQHRQAVGCCRPMACLHRALTCPGFPPGHATAAAPQACKLRSCRRKPRCQRCSALYGVLPSGNVLWSAWTRGRQDAMLYIWPRRQPSSSGLPLRTRARCRRRRPGAVL